MPQAVPLTLTLLPDAFAVCRLAAGAAVPQWAVRSAFFSITRTADELSIVCADASVPADAAADVNVKVERSWRGFKFEGPFAFDQTGILLAAAKPLADAGIGIFVISTFDTDYLLVKDAQLQPAITALVRADHTVREPDQTMAVKFGWRLPNNKRFGAELVASIHGYEAAQDRWIARFERVSGISGDPPPNVTVLIDGLIGKWARIPNEARFGMTLPLKFETLAGRVRYFYAQDPRTQTEGQT
jgi:uncharacterized protein